MVEFLKNNFGLPDGGLYANIIAAALLAVLGLIYGRAFERKAAQRHEDLKQHIMEAKKEKA